MRVLINLDRRLGSLILGLLNEIKKTRERTGKGPSYEIVEDNTIDALYIIQESDGTIYHKAMEDKVLMSYEDFPFVNIPGKDLEIAITREHKINTYLDNWWTYKDPVPGSRRARIEARRRYEKY